MAWRQGEGRAGWDTVGTAYILENHISSPLDNEEKEYSELQGKTATQGLLSYYGSVYILTNGTWNLS